jgi:FkbM family methyltransferase
MRIQLLLRNVFVYVPFFYKLYQNRGMHLIRKRVNPYYEKEFKFLHRLLDSKYNPYCIVDIGGNLGQSSLALERIFSPTEIIIFEPNSLMASECRRLKHISRAKITVEEFGLGKECAENLLYTPVYNGITFWGLASQNKDQVVSFFTDDNIWNYKASKFEIVEKEMAVRTLDSYNIEPNFIKIDVEGMEVDVLLGAEKTIKKFLPVIMVECTGTHRLVKQMLEAKGYKNFELENSNWVLSRGKRHNQIFLPGHIDDSRF